MAGISLCNTNIPTHIAIIFCEHSCRIGEIKNAMGETMALKKVCGLSLEKETESDVSAHGALSTTELSRYVAE